MKGIIALLISLPVYSNTFQLADTGARFTLKISPQELRYSSEGLSRNFKITDCNRRLARNLNAELLEKLPATAGKEGLKFLVDDKTFFLPANGSLTKLVTMMDPRIHQFALEEKKACK